MNWRIFCDFDGTVAQNDVGNLVFTTFGDASHWWALVQAWRDKKIHACELWQKQAAVTRITVEQLDRFVVDQPIDPFFAEFCRRCSEHQLPITVVSDGMDAYIERILRQNGLANLEIRSNRLTIEADGRLQVAFPYLAQSCGSCANCKGLHLRLARQEGAKTVYVGDGYSDLCALAEADLLFAKDDLLSYCQVHHIDCIPYRTFQDVQTLFFQQLSQDDPSR
ncbi:MAG TPA: MtnX-like HAD-IB family phosphatase [bacterium]|jgi:2,3-diketo-5-methylthio-1-phosphopentane phosphatase|nr:MtnX-like HAD-IB family phosphatase [bacterium]HPG45724.1 MtnX-like HAD-IB family phosphatase [bacterium]HPM97497.1 MtnX-like HAD-IB family phosphatase [bacterium]